MLTIWWSRQGQVFHDFRCQAEWLGLDLQSTREQWEVCEQGRAREILLGLGWMTRN